VYVYCVYVVCVYVCTCVCVYVCMFVCVYVCMCVCTPVNRGYEIQIDDHGDEYHRTGVLYSLTQALAKPENLDEWNTMEVTLEGDRTVVKVNGLLVTDFREGQPVPPKKEEWEPDRGPRPLRGYIGLQNHGAGDVVYFREVSVRSLQR